MEHAAGLGAARGHTALAAVLRRQNRFVEARAHLRSALRAAPCHHPARIELARLHRSGWGVPVDAIAAATLLREVTRRAGPGSAAEVQALVLLAELALYGEVQGGLSAARTWLARAAPRDEGARELLAQLPDDASVWEQRPIEAPRPYPLVATLRHLPEGGWERPVWTVPPETPRLKSGVRIRPERWSTTSRIAVGVPGDERLSGGPPGVEDATSSLEIYRCRRNRDCLRFLTVHTNHAACHFGGEVVRHESGEVVAVQTSGPNIVSVDAATGDPSDLRCQIRVRLGEHAEIMEDWPPGCARVRCFERGDPRRRVFARRPFAPGYLQATATLAQRLIEPEIRTRPAWSVSVPGRVRPGRWVSRHRIDVIGGPAIDVTDSVNIARDGSASVENRTYDDYGCYFDGSASRNDAGDLLVTASGPSLLWVHEAEDFAEGPPCTLRLERAGRELRLTNAWPLDCEKNACGEHADLLGLRFRRAR
ncbi:MAG: tetratricopeptide repeat protein [Myxococcota bacterium]